jgi:hypothetical protein
MPKRRAHKRLTEGTKAFLAQLQACGSGMPTENQQVLLATFKRAIEIETTRTPRRPTPDTIVESHHHSGFAEPIDQLGGHDSNHALMPSIASQHQGRVVGVLSCRPQSLGPNPLLNLLPLAIHVVELTSQALSFGRISREEEIEGNLRLAQPPGCIETGCKAETHLGCSNFARFDPGQARQGTQTWPSKSRQLPQAHGRQNPILFPQWNEIGNRAQGDQI